MLIMGARMRTPATWVSNVRSRSLNREPAKCDTSVDVPPMSKPMILSKPAASEAHAAQLLRNPIHVPAQDGRQVGVHHRRVPAGHELHQRAHFMRNGNLRVAGGARQLPDPLLVLPVAVAVHEHDRGRAIALAVCRFELAPGSSCPAGTRRW